MLQTEPSTENLHSKTRDIIFQKILSILFIQVIHAMCKYLWGRFMNTLEIFLFKHLCRHSNAEWPLIISVQKKKNCTCVMSTHGENLMERNVCKMV